VGGGCSVCHWSQS